jgi:hypothetical protein
MNALLFVASLLAQQGDRPQAAMRCDPGFLRMALPESLGRRARDDARPQEERAPVRRLDCHRPVNA